MPNNPSRYFAARQDRRHPASIPANPRVPLRGYGLVVVFAAAWIAAAIFH